jgi:hypothetical protein
MKSRIGLVALLLTFGASEACGVRPDGEVHHGTAGSGGSAGEGGGAGEGGAAAPEVWTEGACRSADPPPSRWGCASTYAAALAMDVGASGFACAGRCEAWNVYMEGWLVGRWAPIWCAYDPDSGALVGAVGCTDTPAYCQESCAAQPESCLLGGASCITYGDAPSHEIDEGWPCVLERPRDRDHDGCPP